MQEFVKLLDVSQSQTNGPCTGHERSPLPPKPSPTSPKSVLDRMLQKRENKLSSSGGKLDTAGKAGRDSRMGAATGGHESVPRNIREGGVTGKATSGLYNARNGSAAEAVRFMEESRKKVRTVPNSRGEEERETETERQRDKDDREK